MSRTEITELTVLCLIHDEERYLLQDRVSEDWKGYTLPGGHVEKEPCTGSRKRKSITSTWLKISSISSML